MKGPVELLTIEAPYKLLAFGYSYFEVLSLAFEA